MGMTRKSEFHMGMPPHVDTRHPTMSTRSRSVIPGRISRRSASIADPKGRAPMAEPVEAHPADFDRHAADL